MADKDYKDRKWKVYHIACFSDEEKRINQLLDQCEEFDCCALYSKQADKFSPKPKFFTDVELFNAFGKEVYFGVEGLYRLNKTWFKGHKKGKLVMVVFDNVSFKALQSKTASKAYCIEE